MQEDLGIERVFIGGDLGNGYNFNLIVDSVEFQGTVLSDALGNGHSMINAKISLLDNR